ncbi:MAG: argininosuccinate lyase, partial [Chloroflexi bacterium]|nr:argininosuccinate lyase [Chloroflexota bacterium]
MVRNRDAARSRPTPASFFASLSFDRRLASYDVRGSAAWAHALADAGVLTHDEEEAILGGLRTIADELKAGTFPFREELEDIHFNVERRLTELIGPLGGKLHTGRSRNDQVATDLRLYVKDAIDGATMGLRSFRRETIAQAEAHLDTVMPGYTHLQRAQPILLAHHLMAYVAMAERDSDRLHDARRRTDLMPLGSAALAGTAYPIDRDALAADLDFRGGATRNSIDAVSDRDFVVEFEAAAAMTMAHLS